MLKKTDDTTKLFLIGIVFLVMILYIFVTAIKDNKDVDYSFINNSLKKIGNNYTLNVSMLNKKIVYSRDKEVEVFESDDFSSNKYIKYNNKIYVLHNDIYEETINNNDLINKYYYDLELINKVIPYCKYYNNYRDEVLCKIKNDDYNNELLAQYGLGRSNDSDVEIDFYYKDKVVNKMTINYGEEEVNIEVDNKGNNDFSDLIKMIK